RTTCSPTTRRPPREVPALTSTSAPEWSCPSRAAIPSRSSTAARSSPCAMTSASPTAPPSASSPPSSHLAISRKGPAMQLNRPAFIAALFALATSCAKVGPPSAIITALQSVNSGSLVVLDASKSTDPEARPLAFTWSFQVRPAGSSAAIQDPQAAKTSFMADVAGDYVVALVVSNSVVTSAPVAMTITASQCGTSAPNAGTLKFTPEAPFIGSTLQFSSDSSDPDNAPGCAQNQTLSYSWTLIGMPAGSTTSLNNAAASSPSLVADVSGAYVVQLVVTAS